MKPYAGFVEDGVDGILADNTREAWLEAFRRISDQGMRDLIRENSQTELKTKYSFEAIEKKLFEDIPELLYEHRDWNKRIILWPYKIKNRLYKAADLPMRAAGRMRIEGIKSTFSWMMKHYVRKEK